MCVLVWVFKCRCVCPAGCVGSVHACGWMCICVCVSVFILPTNQPTNYPTYPPTYVQSYTQWEQGGLNSRADLAAFAAIPHHPDYVAPGDRMHHMRQVQVRKRETNREIERGCVGWWVVVCDEVGMAVQLSVYAH